MSYTSETVMGGRWLTMDVGDMGGDSDPDVVLEAGHDHAEGFEGEVAPLPKVLVLKNSRSRPE